MKQNRNIEENHAYRDEDAEDEPDSLDDFFIFRVEKHSKNIVYWAIIARMFELRKRSVRERILGSKITLCILLVAVIIFARSVFNVYAKYEEAAGNARRSGASLSTLQTQEQSLSASVSALGTSAGVEDEIRRKFQVTKDGENLIVIVDPDNGAATSTPAAVGEGWWAGMVHKLGF